MKKLLIFTAIIESATGIALLAAPALLISILLGSALESPAGLVVARLAGVALISFSIACWSGSRDVKSHAVIGVVAAMLFYNIAAVLLLMGCRVCAGMAGIGLLPASVLHVGLAVWGTLRIAYEHSSRSLKQVDSCTDNRRWSVARRTLVTNASFVFDEIKVLDGIDHNLLDLSVLYPIHCNKIT